MHFSSKLWQLQQLMILVAFYLQLSGRSFIFCINYLHKQISNRKKRKNRTKSKQLKPTCELKLSRCQNVTIADTSQSEYHSALHSTEHCRYDSFIDTWQPKKLDYHNTHIHIHKIHLRYIVIANKIESLKISQ